jgi:hypothetical protein
MMLDPSKKRLQSRDNCGCGPVAQTHFDQFIGGRSVEIFDSRVAGSRELSQRRESTWQRCAWFRLLLGSPGKRETNVTRRECVLTLE